MSKKITVTVISIVFVCSPCSLSSTKDHQSLMPVINNSYQGSLDDIRFIELQIDSVNTDMDLCLRWLFSEKNMMRKASVKAIHDLKTIRDYLQKISFTGDLSELRDINLTIIDMLVQTYEEIETKQEEEISKSFAECSEIYCKYIKKYKEYSLKHSHVEDLSEDLSLIHNADPNEEDAIFDPEKEIDILSEILDANEYSPVLLSMWYEWRARKQFFEHGLSNMSEIPNLEYNLKRWGAIQNIKEHIRDTPDDAWAKTQMRLLLSLPNIGRGNNDFGNDVLGMGKIN